MDRIVPKEDLNGYLFIADEDLQLTNPSGVILTKAGPMHGKYLHRMVVYSFGDMYGNRYISNPNSVVDHFDMNHKNNDVSNLQQISNVRNLWRAWYFTKSDACRERYQSARAQLTPIELEDFLIEKEADILRFNRKDCL